MEFLDHIEFWHWWVLAGILLILELLAPAYFFLWLGIAAVAVGFLVLAFGSVAIAAQLVTFAVLAIIAVVAWRRYRETEPQESD